MTIKSLLSRLFALVLVACIGLVGCSTSTVGLTGNYGQDTLAVIETMRAAINVASDATNKADLQTLAREQINDYISRYRRADKYTALRSFTTMQTALNSLAGYYTSYGNRPLPDKLKNRLEREFKEVELAVNRGS
ncbi:MAG: photosystem II protein Psb27 [Chloroflexaceae bacterium]|nr:photosystem II protein Psb27 [Chloroflexaceae bacterium]